MSDVNGLRLIPKVTPQSRCFGNHTSPPIGGDMDSVCCSTQYGRGFLFLGVSDSQITESGIDMKLGESRESDDVPVAIPLVDVHFAVQQTTFDIQRRAISGASLGTYRHTEA